MDVSKMVNDSLEILNLNWLLLAVLLWIGVLTTCVAIPLSWDEVGLSSLLALGKHV